ncbi:Tll0287-like domain-containing protein [Xanthovirga aplysinae]|uniref:Tll0287-like domain-containing protein n=1 Tax=Xanthovirga aplysinae TaxID=2529853 RepID=UPI0012BB63C3|nr:DUF3365 domain-containing protein [Xanthovirga aplysinae]MTI31940.1 DUF3365 domain-containing protein [Xanthovirga aplysinae]
MWNIKIKWAFVSLIFLTIMSACDAGLKRKKKSEALRKEMKSRELKFLTPSEIATNAYKVGDLVVKAAEKEYIERLTEMIKEKGVTYAIPYCQFNDLMLTDSLSDLYQVKIKRVSLRPRNPENTADSLESQLIDAYQYSIDQKLSSADNLQELDNGDFLLTKAIVLDQTMCTQCHGTKEQIGPKNLKLIRKIYPKDQSIDFKEGDLMGMWSIHIPRKELIEAL